MKRGVYRPCKGKLDSCRGKPVKIVGISSDKRSVSHCAREDPVSLYYLKLALKEAQKHGAVTQLIDLRELKVGACNGCYSTNPAQCRFSEKTNQCDCYPYKEDVMFVDDNTSYPIERAYDVLKKGEFFRIYHDKNSFAGRDDMWVVYKALREADGVIFATSTQFYDRPPLLQTMFSRLCALDGGVEKLWGDGKNLRNSVAYSKNPRAVYKQRLYGKWCAFINCSKEGDSVTPNLMKACTMMGMRIIPLGVAYRVNWYDDPTHRSDTAKSMKDEYTLSLIRHMAKEMVENIKRSSRVYGIYSRTV